MYNIGKACGRSVPIVRCRSTRKERLSPSADARSVTWRHRRRKEKKSRQLRIRAASFQQVHCHENLNMSIKLCVCIVRDGVQMVLLQVWGCPNIEPKLLGGKWKVSTPVCDEHVP